MVIKYKYTIQQLIKKLGMVFDGHPVICVLALAFAVTLVVEMASRHSPLKGIVFLFTHPVNFIANMTIVLVTLAIGLFFKKRVFFLSLFSAFWLFIGIVNATLLGFRTTPFGVADIALLPSIITVIRAYMEVWQALLIIAALLFALTVLVFIFLKSPKYVPPYRMAASFMMASVIAAICSYGLTVVGHEEDRSEFFANIGEAYKQFGFIYCFCTEAAEMGIDEPGFYSWVSVNRLVGNLEEAPEPELYPDIVMVQLESFFDVGYLDDVSYEGNPIPVFTNLKENYSSGFLTVPSVGAGTANTEFEVLSGMSLDFFGMGEYPYNTILREEACETVATNLKSLGYTAHAVHNNTGTFYRRNEVFTQLGFDTFTSIEFMENVEYNPIGWAKDYVLTEEIIKALDSANGQNFVFAITVQDHGKYQRGIDSEDMENLDIVWEDNAADSAAFAYYLGQLRETDEFIGELVDALNHRPKPTVLVLYGDHLPNFNIGSEELQNGDIFETEYVIWNNFGLPVEDKDLSAFQLSAEVLRQLGIDNGILTKYHQQMSDSSDYINGLSILEYDMLYGEFYCYGGENPYTASELRMGVEPITISDVIWEDNMMTVCGEHFTRWSRVAIDGKILDTVFMDNGTLTVELEKPPEKDAVITVQQMTATMVTLAESEGVIWR